MLYMIIGAFVLSFLLCPVLMALCKKFDLYDEVDARKVHTGKIPRMGGIAVFLSFFVFVFLYFLLCVPNGRFPYFSVLVGAGIVFLLGASDDFLNLRARVKFIIQMAAAFCAAMSPCYLGNILGWHVPVLLSRCLTFFWVLLLVNAYNLIDGLDLLCGGISFITLATIGGVQIFNGSFQMGIVCFILCAALLGFLFWNRPPAKIFLGDGGSLTLGYAIAVLPLFPSNNLAFEFNKILICLLLASIPTIDVVAAVIRRGREKRSFFSPDRAHLHHKLINIGFTKVTASVLLNIIQLLLCAITFISISYGRKLCIIMLSFAYCFAIIFFVVIHYVNRGVNAKLKGCLSENAQEEH